MPRLFVATYLNSDGVERIQQLARANSHLGEKWNMRARFVTADKLHLTWLFLGDVEDESVDEVADALGAAVGKIVGCSPLSPESSGSSSSEAGGSLNHSSNSGFPSLSYDHFELWPSARKARLGVIIPSTVPANIVELAGAISKNLSKFLPAEEQEKNKRPFKPHLTVMRLGPQSRKGSGHSGQGNSRGNSGQGKPRACIEDVIVPSPVFPICQSIDRVELIESDMGKKVQGYLTRASFDYC